MAQLPPEYITEHMGALIAAAVQIYAADLKASPVWFQPGESESMRRHLRQMAVKEATEIADDLLTRSIPENSAFTVPQINAHPFDD